MVNFGTKVRINASIFPDFVDRGSIDLMLSKPIGRTRLFFTKFLTGLLFAGLQVTVFTLASFLVIGLRGGDWEPWIFIAVPLVLVLRPRRADCAGLLLGLGRFAQLRFEGREWPFEPFSNPFRTNRQTV